MEASRDKDAGHRGTGQEGLRQEQGVLWTGHWTAGQKTRSWPEVGLGEAGGLEDHQGQWAGSMIGAVMKVLVLVRRDRMIGRGLGGPLPALV